MNQSPENNLVETPTPQSPLHSPVKRRRFIRAGVAVFLTAIFLLIGYSICMALLQPDRQETVVLGPGRIAAGSPAGFRILVRDRISLQPVKGAKVTLHLRAKNGREILLGQFRTDESGSLADPIPVPPLPPGDYRLTIDSESTLGRDQVAQQVKIQTAAGILLTSDKPLYQPGQTIHLRSLLLNQMTGSLLTNELVTFEVKDAKGNKVFKEARKSSGFGIVSADFVLATELNLGRYELRALAGDSTTERSVEIKPFVLPKFKIHVTTDQPYYLPGQKVSGSLTANYFFGKPVSKGSFKLTATALQAKPVVVSEQTGSLDATGRADFHFSLPGEMAGTSTDNLQTILDLTAEVRDSAQHVENQSHSITVADKKLELVAIPEAGAWVTGVENVLYILTDYPDGRPAACQVSIDGRSYQAETNGITVVKLVPSAATQQFGIQAVDSQGRTAQLQFKADIRSQYPPLLLRADKAVYRAGDVARLTILSPEPAKKTVFIDLLKNNQTVLTRSVSLTGHETQYALPLPTSLAGFLKINAYFITESGEERGCSRLLFVNPGSGLKLAAQWSKPVYAPSEIAGVTFALTDAHGRPAPGALGIIAVDESVYALSDQSPGRLNRLMETDSQFLRPRCQLKAFDSPGFLLTDNQPTLAQAYLSSFQTSPPSTGLDELIQAGGLTPRQIERTLEMRGTPEYEKLRADPQFAPVISLLEDQNQGYNFREATGIAKVRAVEARRNAYFGRLEKYLFCGFLGLLFLTPVILLIRSTRSGWILETPSAGRTEIQHYIQLANSLCKSLTALILLPFLCYPAGFYLLEENGSNHGGWWLLGFETALVLWASAWQFQRITRAQDQAAGFELAPLSNFLRYYLLQFGCSRLLVLWMALVPHQGGDFDALAFLGWAGLSILAPVLVLSALETHVEDQLKIRRITAKVVPASGVALLLLFFGLLILAGLMLPALAKAKQKAGRISLLNDLKQIELAKRLADEDRAASTGNGPAEPRVRRDFPETLLWRPELITDDQGKAHLEIPLADSITTWRVSLDAVNQSGRRGSCETSIRVFQDFFIDLDLPVSLSLGDEISLPVTCHNYLQEPQDIRLELADGNWFASRTHSFRVHLNAGEVKAVHLPLKVLRVGLHKLKISAQGTKAADAIERDLRVVPTGERIDFTSNHVLKDSLLETFSLPNGIVPDSQRLLIKLYPSRFSEVVEGLESVFHAPYGCFEQTSSTTYPNVLVLDYLKRTRKVTPEIESQARKYINAGYQRLLTFEVPGGGFEWFGQDPANVCLTAYGILEFTDMAKVHPVDQAVIERARKWLFSRQSSDGSWNERNRGWTWQGRGSLTAFVAWALAESGDQSPELAKALAYLRSNEKQISNTYAKALTAIALLAHDRNDTFGHQLAAQLKNEALQDDQTRIHWKSAGYSVTFSHDSGMETECTALCAMALMKDGTSPESVKRALTWISARKFADGTLGSTQATILAMRALLAAYGNSPNAEFTSTVSVLLNGQLMQTFSLTRDNQDVMKQFDATKQLQPGENRIELRQSPTGELACQCVGEYWLPNQPLRVPSATPQPARLQIDLTYDRTTKLKVDEPLKCTVIVSNQTGQLINMAMVDLGIPPGFEVDPAPFEQLRQEGRIAKYEITGNQVLLYLRELAHTIPFQFSYLLRAKYPLRVEAPPGLAYEYYQPSNRAVSKTTILEVAAGR